MLKKLLLCMTIALGLVLFLSSCGVADVPNEEEPTQAASDVSLNFFDLFDDEEIEWIEQAGFERENFYYAATIDTEELEAARELFWHYIFFAPLEYSDDVENFPDLDAWLARANSYAALNEEIANAMDGAESMELMFTAANLNLRASPSTQAEVLELVPRGTVVSVLTRVGEWYRVLYNNQIGYMSAEFLSVDYAAETTAPQANAGSSGITYEQLARNPLDFVFQSVTLTGLVASTGGTSGLPNFIMYVNGNPNHRALIEYFGFNERVIQGDWVTFTGESLGLCRTRNIPWIRQTLNLN